MAKVKMSKKATSIDMTAMCDVAFLLLTFFILTATTKIPEPLQVDTPATVKKDTLQKKNLVTLSIGKGKVFFDVKGKKLRRRTLELMAQTYKVEFTDAEKDKFALMEAIGTPIENLSELMKLSNADRAKSPLQATGIPKDSTGNQLKSWIISTHDAMIEENENDQIAIAIKGDSKEEYPTVQKVMDILQDLKINTFSLITGLKGK
jgi:biopolymer transport protein ExbD